MNRLKKHHQLLPGQQIVSNAENETDPHKRHLIIKRDFILELDRAKRRQEEIDKRAKSS